MQNEVQCIVPPPPPGHRWTGVRMEILNDMHRPVGGHPLHFRVSLRLAGMSPATRIRLHALENEWTMLPIFMAEQGDQNLYVRVPMPDAEQYSGQIQFLAQRL